jgi:membrane dipeptidase
MRVVAVIGCLFAGYFVGVSGSDGQGGSDEELLAKAKRLAQEYIIVDTHIDAPERMTELKKEDDLSVNSKGQFDYVKAKGGGLDCGFMSIYIPASYQKTGGAKAFAESLITMVEGWAKRWPDKFVLVCSAADVTAQSATGRVLLAMGMENGAGFENDSSNVQYFYNKGIRYATLTHSKDNLICDSSFDTTGTWKGLSPFGRKIVEEMNRVGIIVDVSHITDSAFYQVMQLTKAPVIASHSSCRYFTPGFERNMSDDMIRVLASRGGVIQINFGSFFITDEYRKYADNMEKVINEHLKANGISPTAAAGKEYARKYRKEHPVRSPDVADVAAHIDHVAKLVGVDFVGLGSDFDGVGDNLPTGLKTVADYPNLIRELLKKGYSDDDIRKICSGNLLRVWAAVENVARMLKSH